MIDYCTRCGGRNLGTGFNCLDCGHIEMGFTYNEQQETAPTYDALTDSRRRFGDGPILERGVE